MPSLIVEYVLADVNERLQRRAETRHRTLPEETLHLLRQVLQEDDKPAVRLPELILDEEVPAPDDLPRSSQSVPTAVRTGAPRLPDALLEAVPGTCSLVTIPH